MLEMTLKLKRLLAQLQPQLAGNGAQQRGNVSAGDISTTLNYKFAAKV